MYVTQLSRKLRPGDSPNPPLFPRGENEVGLPGGGRSSGDGAWGQGGGDLCL